MSNEQIQMVVASKIKPKRNIRTEIDLQSLEGLAQSIREVGLLSPLRVMRGNDEFPLIDGERRFRAMLILKMAEIPVIIEDRELCEARVTQQQLIANCQRKNLKPLEIAMAIEELMRDIPCNASEAASKLGFSDATVSRLLALLKLPPEIQEKVQSGAIAPATGYHISKECDPVKQAELAQQAATGELTRDSASKRVNRRRRSASASKKPALSRVKSLLGEHCSVVVAAPSLAFDSFIEILERLVGMATTAREQGVDFETFFKMHAHPTK